MVRIIANNSREGKKRDIIMSNATLYKFSDATNHYLYMDQILFSKPGVGISFLLKKEKKKKKKKKKKTAVRTEYI